MARYSMNEQTTYRWSFDEDLLHIRDAGYDAIGIWLRKLFDFGPERAIDLVNESGLAVSSVSWAGGFTGADAATADENIAAARDAIRLAAELRADSLVLYTGGRNGHTKRHSDRLVNAALDALLPIAEEHGVPLALEPMHPSCAGEWTLLTSVEETLELVKTHQSAALKMSLDTYHFSLEELEDSLLRELIQHLAVVHVGDYVEPRGIDLARVPLGEGEAPLGSTIPRLLQAGYEGCFEVKLLGPDIETVDYHGLLKQSLLTLNALERTEPSPPPSQATVPPLADQPQPASTRATRPVNHRPSVDSAERVALHLRP